MRNPSDKTSRFGARALENECRLEAVGLLGEYCPERRPLVPGDP
jgi:hypothetical protein